ncbi:UBX domain-containing protein 6 [Cloeon dipterum]|uniref:UBX domain-containing protein 6 n=1 Tax=Cloeon dipterum TaxID=197152 RepID=UPI0032207A24
MAGGGKKNKDDEKLGSKIQRFFKGKKNEAKVKLGMTGPGYRLGDAATSSSTRSSSSSSSGTSREPVKRVETSQEARQAGAAALARMGKKGSDDAAFGTSMAAIRAQARRELEAEKAAAAAAAAPPKEESPPPPVQDPERMLISGIYFACPMIGPEVLTKKEWDIKIREFLYEQLEHERSLTAVLMIHSLTKNREKVEQCVALLQRMFDNLIQNPDVEKYRRIKLDSNAFRDKLKDVEGALELLLAVGFEEQEIANDAGVMEKYLVLPADRLGEDGREHLMAMCDALSEAEPITLQLDRGMQVMQPVEASRRTELPPEIYRLTPQELKRLQQAKTEAIERGQILRTKAMREKEEAREMKTYKYAVIRVRFPNNVLLQGTFNVYEKLAEVLAFIREQLHSWEGMDKRPFVVTTPTGEKLSEGGQEETMNLMDLKLVPTAILNFAWSKPLPAGAEESYLKPEVLSLLSQL